MSADSIASTGPSPLPPVAALESPAPPPWLDEAIIERALREGRELPAARVSALSLQPANAPGDNYVSQMWRATGTLHGGSESNEDGGRSCKGRLFRDKVALVVKCLPVGERFRRLVVESETFEAEGHMFSAVVPQTEAVLAEAGLASEPLAARLLLSDSNPEPFLVFDDLTAQGFRCEDRRVGLDDAHARLALRTLARFHAASALLLQRAPSVMAPARNFFTEPVRTMFSRAVRTSLAATAARVRTWGDSWAAGAAAELAARAETLFDEFAAATCARRLGEFTCALHGDFWTSNIMFRHDDSSGAPRDLRFVDLQLSHAGSPAADLLYFLYSSLDDATAPQADALLAEYCEALRSDCALLGVEPAPSDEELRAAMAARGAVALVAAMAVRPITRAKTDRVYDMEASIADSDASAQDAAHLFADPDYEASLRVLLPQFMACGWLQPALP